MMGAMTEPEHRICREYIAGDPAHDCGKPAAYRIRLDGGRIVVYKCSRHAVRFTAEKETII